MQISKLVKIIGVVIALVVITITLIVTIDKLDFVARWLWHLEPYKDNVENIICACLIVILILNVIRKFKGVELRKYVKALKANIRGFGFEVELTDRECADNKHCEETVPESDVAGAKPSKNAQYANCGYWAERKIISQLSAEFQLTFATNTVLSRGGCRYEPDGFAVKNGRAYIVEVKVADRLEVIERAIARLKTFADMVQETKIAHATVILCVVTRRPIAYFLEKIKSVNLGEETEFIFRVFSLEQLERIEDVAP